MTFTLGAAIDFERVLLLTSFAVLAGLPVLEELLRTLRRSSVATEEILRSRGHD
jgi:hypothetical protein